MTRLPHHRRRLPQELLPLRFLPIHRSLLPSLYPLQALTACRRSPFFRQHLCHYVYEFNTNPIFPIL